MKRYKQNEVDELANILKKDGVISVPTDTVYGVCARINSIEAKNNLIKVKNRPEEKLFPIMCADEKQIKEIAVVNEKAESLIRKFMPGPITLVLIKKQSVPEFVNNGRSTIAVRMATSDSLKELILKVGSPIFMSSANKSGKPACTNLDEIEKMCPEVDGMMEGDVNFGMPSTIVDCTGDDITILREGPISKEEILKALK